MSIQPALVIRVVVGIVAFFSLPSNTPAQPSDDRELRGVWVVGQDLLKSESEIGTMLDKLAAANFNTIFVDVWWRGFVTYPGSKIVPQIESMKDKDTIGFVVERAHKLGLQVHFWFGYGFYAYYTKDSAKDTSFGPLLTAHPELMALDINGRKFNRNSLGDFYALCPSNPRSHELLGQIMVEAISRYPVDGVHLDRIRYPQKTYCYCNYCKTRFTTDTGIALEQFGEHSEAALNFLKWKRERTLDAVRHFEKVVHAARPGLLMSSYVVGPDEMDDKAQGWDLWMKEKLLDVVAVSMYGKTIDKDLEKALRRLDGDRSHLACAISADEDKTTEIYLRNVGVAREAKSMGMVTWYAGAVMDDLEALAAGAYSQSAKSPLRPATAK